MENVEDMEIELDQLDCPNVRGQAGQLLVLPLVVLREVLENLSSADCLNLSLVNKVWHREAQIVLRDRGRLTAKLNTGDGRCKDLRDFASYLRGMKEVEKVVPLSSLTIAVSGEDHHHGDWCQETSPGELDQIYEDIVRQMEWKHLTLDLTDDWDQKEDCAGFQLVKKILHNRSSVLTAFSLKIESNHEAFNQHFLQDYHFSSLKKFTFRGRQRNGGDEELIKALVSRSPNLKVLCTKSPVNLADNLLEGRSAAVHESIMIFPGDDIPESIVSQLRLRGLILTSICQDFAFERFDGMVPMLLQIFHTTLRFMCVDAVLLVALMHYGICLENVVELVVIFSKFDMSEPRSRRLLKSFDFTRYFPNLRSFHILCHMHHRPNLEHTWSAVIDMVEQGNAALNEPTSPSINIKQLNLILYGGIRDASVRFLVEMFPHIEKLAIIARSGPVCFWDYWLDLEELDIALLLSPDVAQNLDSVFCGIFPQEVAHLQQHNEEYLQNVNIVPLMPSLSCLKRLKTLKVYFHVATGSDGRPTCTLSKVTGLIAFKRRPHLTVTLETNNDIWRQELEQMESYATVQLTRRNIDYL